MFESRLQYGLLCGPCSLYAAENVEDARSSAALENFSETTRGPQQHTKQHALQTKSFGIMASVHEGK